jgi:hypothetical protein
MRVRLERKRHTLRDEVAERYDKLLARLKGRIDRIRTLCDDAGENGSVKVSDLRRIIGGGE